MSILKQYRNLLLQIIQEKGLNPQIFKPEEIEYEDHTSFVITLIDSPMKFIVRSHANNYHSFIWAYTYFEPRFHMADTSSFVDVKGLRATFEDWLENHVKLYIYELSEPDMWERVESQKPLIKGVEISQEDTTLFSEDEKIRIRMSLDKFRTLLIKNFEPQNYEIQAINDHLEYLLNAVDRLNKFDWRGLALMIVIQISLALSLDTEKGRLLYNLFEQAFSNILKLMP